MPCRAMPAPCTNTHSGASSPLGINADQSLSSSPTRPASSLVRPATGAIRETQVRAFISLGVLTHRRGVRRAAICPLPAARTTASGGIHQRLLWISHANRKHPPAQRNQLAQTLPKAKKRSSRPQDRNLRSKDRYHPSPHSSNRNRLSPARTDTRARKSNPPTSTPVVGLAWRAYPPSVQTLAKNIHV
jgi:hypothetical protein